MRAAFYEKNGSAREVLSLGEVDTPKPGPGEVRVRLKTSGRQSVRRQVARGPHPQDRLSARDPAQRRRGRDRSGGRRRAANRASASGSGPGTGNGSAPSAPAPTTSCCPQRLPCRCPTHVSYEAGACLGIPAMTAYHAVEVAGAAKTVLVSGGAGGVGHYAIQFAKARGATVITTVSSEAKAKLARDAGADHTIDYKRENVGERVMAMTGKAGVDAVIEMDFCRQCQADAVGAASAQHCGGLWQLGSAEATIPSQFLLSNAITIRTFLSTS